MTEEEIKLLKAKINSGTVKILFKDSELAEAKVTSVYEDEESAVIDIVSTSTPKKYSDISDGLIFIKFADIESVS